MSSSPPEMSRCYDRLGECAASSVAPPAVYQGAGLRFMGKTRPGIKFESSRGIDNTVGEKLRAMPWQPPAQPKISKIADLKTSS